MTVFALRIHDDLLTVRFAVSPVWETQAAVQALADERGRSYHEPWLLVVRARVARLDLAPLLAVLPRRGYVPDFLTPPPRTSRPGLRAQLAEIRATAPAQVAREVEQRSRALARHGLRHVLDELHPKIRWTGRGLSLADRNGRTVEVGERGFLLMPSAYLWPHVAAIVEEPWLPTIIYPVTGIAGLWQASTAPPGALGRLLGRTRALVLTALDQPLSTTALAAMTELSPAGVSRHLLALRDAGLVSAARHGHEVRYRRTELGSALLHARRENNHDGEVSVQGPLNTAPPPGPAGQ